MTELNPIHGDIYIKHVEGIFFIRVTFFKLMGT